MADDKSYDAADLSLPEFTGRTRLYHLRPLGIGTPMVESLTGYVGRLAAAHVVSPGALLYQELGPCVGAYRSSSDDGDHRSFVYCAHTLNGMTENTEKWAAAIAMATGVESVRSLTMLPWKGVFSARGVIRPRRAWCACCYGEWRLHDVEIYEPLLWMLETVSICPSHHRPLTTSCPHCARQSYAISSRSFPGHCSSCGQWLGEESVTAADGGEAANAARRTADQVATLFGRSSVMEQAVSGEVLRMNLRCCLNDLAARNERLLGRAFEIHEKTVERWWSGLTLPSLRNLLKICCRLEVPLLRFLTEPMSAGDSDWEHARQAVSRYQTPHSRSRRIAVVRAVLDEALHAPEPPSLLAVAVKAGFKHQRSLEAYDAEACSAIHDRHRAMRGAKKRSKSIPKERVEEGLEVALRQEPPPSLREVSLSLGFQHTFSLVSRFPVQCRLLTQRSQDHRRNRRALIETVLKAALMEEPPPTVKEVEKRLGVQATQMRTWFPDLYPAFVARARRRRDWRLAGIRSVLEKMAVEEPPPPAKAAAVRTGVARGYLCELFPDLWRELVARHAAHKKDENARRRAAFQAEVRRIAQELLNRGKYASRRRVEALLPKSNFSGRHLIVREVKKVLERVNGRSRRRTALS